VINKKNVLGREPDELGMKDAIHTAIVAVRAGAPVKPGQRCGLNEYREAVPDEKGVGVADPFRRTHISTGQPFWLLLAQDEVPNVRHVWEHPDVDFTPPAREVKRNHYLQQYADALGVSYQQLMDAAAYVVEHGESAPYPGTKTAEELEEAWEEHVDSYELWSEWGSEAFHEFENEGTACCPEYNYPECSLFEVR